MEGICTWLLVSEILSALADNFVSVDARWRRSLNAGLRWLLMVSVSSSASKPISSGIMPCGNGSDLQRRIGVAKEEGKVSEVSSRLAGGEGGGGPTV